MKKLLSIILCLALLLSVGLPAMAAGDSLEKRLTAVTKAVKKTLSIGDEYTEFSGDANEDPVNPVWNLYWTSDTKNLNVTANESGKVLRFTYDDGKTAESRFWGFDPAFPKGDEAEALKTAQAFADKLMGDKESVKLEPDSRSSTDSLYFTSTLLLNGLPSPVEVTMRLRAADLVVLSYRRTDAYSSVIPGVPSAKSNTSAGKAEELLKSILKLTPYYVLEDDGKTASLRYVSETEGDYIVTAADGKLVDLEQVYAELADDYNRNGYKLTMDSAASAEAAEDGGSAGGSRLSETELSGIEKLKDVRSKDALDKGIRAIKALGIDSQWTLETTNYIRNADEDILATLRYSRPMNEDERAAMGEGWDGELLQVSKYVRVDARTGALRAVSTYNYAIDRYDTPTVTDESRALAESFLKEQFPEEFAQSAAHGEPQNGLMVYAQKVNGYLFPESRASIKIGKTGCVDELWVHWQSGVTFESAEGVISADEAVKACFDAFEMPLSYLEYPVLQNNMLVYKYVLAYALHQPDNDSYFGGINAKTGEPVWKSYRSAAIYSYTDLAGCFGRTQIEALAAYGVGLSGDKFQPKAKLDQKTMLALLVSACGYEIDLSDEDALDRLYSIASNEGLIAMADRAPDAAVTRMTFIKTLLGASIYGEAAKVKGIYTCPFADKDKIAESDLGYAALAYGLGMARGDELGRLNPTSTMTRQEAAVMLYHFMKR